MLTMFMGKMRPDLPKGYAWAPSLLNPPSHTQLINVGRRILVGVLDIFVLLI